MKPQVGIEGRGPGLVLQPGLVEQIRQDPPPSGERGPPAGPCKKASRPAAPRCGPGDGPG